MKTAEELGFNKEFEDHRIGSDLMNFEVGRVALEHKDRYVVKTASMDYDAELVGNLRFSAESRSDLPVVGDWVAFSKYDDYKALIHAVYPRKSVIERQAAGKSREPQIIATNVDFGLIVQSVNRDFNLNRLERYITICNSSDVVPIIVLTKVDLVDSSEVSRIMDRISRRINSIKILTVSNITKGYGDLEAFLIPKKTYCLLGSSGVGKSTILNHLLKIQKMKTAEIGESTERGRHITSHRELVVLRDGAILIDNPGMREVGMTDVEAGLELTFEDIYDLSEGCRFKDCTHMHEEGCEVLEALSNGELDQDSYNNFRKMEKEKAHYESDVAERRKKDKDFGKLIKRVIKEHKKRKF